MCSAATRRARGARTISPARSTPTDARRRRVVDDQVGGPTAAGDLADFILAAARRWAAAEAGDPAFGVTHFAGTPTVSWKGFAEAVVEAAGLKARVVGIATAEYPTRARRP